MRHTFVLSLFVCPLAVGIVATAQQPLVQNAVRETRAVTLLARDVSAAGGAEPGWIGWQVPMVAGDRDLCSTWSNDDRTVRGTTLENTNVSRPPSFPGTAGPLPLEAGTELVVMIRVADGKFERLRTVSADCPVDVGGRRFTWLSGVTPAASLEYLRSLATPALVEPLTYRRSIETVVAAIALHQNASAGPLLVELASRTDDPPAREAAIQWLARARGAFGFDYLTRTLANTTDPADRRRLVIAITRTREPRTASVLLALATADADQHIRAEAIAVYATLAGRASEVTAIIASDRNSEVRSRGVSGLLRRTGGDGVLTLIELARSTVDFELRKEIVRGLGRSDDMRAVAFLEELVRR